MNHSSVPERLPVATGAERSRRPLVAAERDLHDGLTRLAEHAHRSVLEVGAVVCSVDVGGRPHVSGSGPAAAELVGLDMTRGLLGVDPQGRVAHSSSHGDEGDVWSTVVERLHGEGLQSVVTVQLRSRAGRRVGRLGFFASATASVIPPVTDPSFEGLVAALGFAVDSLRVVASAELTSVLMRTGSATAFASRPPGPPVLVQ